MRKFRRIMFIAAIMLFATMLMAAAYAEAIDMANAVLPTEFYIWDELGTYAGAAALVALITQLTKELRYINKIPTQVWSYILAVVILIASQAFTGTLTGSSAALALANGVLVSLASNGGYSLITRVKTTIAN